MRFEPTPSQRAGGLPAVGRAASGPSRPTAPTATATTSAPVPDRRPGGSAGADSSDSSLSFSDVVAWLAGIPWRVVLALSLVLLGLAAPGDHDRRC